MNGIILRSTAVLLVTAILLLTPTMALADGGDDGYVVTANGYQVELVFKEPAAIGENEFHIQITDSMGMPVPDAEVEVSAMPVEGMSAHDEGTSVESNDTDSMSGMDMPAEAPTADSMSSMPGMDMPTETAPAPMDMDVHDEPGVGEHTEEPIHIILKPAHELGEYSGEISLDKSGAWIFNVHFTINGEMTTVEFPIEVVRAGSNLGVLAGFLGFNATVIAAAAIMKRKLILYKY